MIGVLWLLLTASPVEVVVEGCELQQGEVQRLASLELARGPDEAHVGATLTCTDGQLEVRVDDPVTNKSLSRRTPLSALPQSTRERFVALAIAELVEASWSELLLPAPHLDAKSSPSTRREAEQVLPTRRVRLLAVGGVKVFPERGVWQGGGGLRAHLSLLGPLGAAVELGAEHGETRLTAGRVAVDSLSGAAFLTLRAEWSRVVLTAGPGLRLGGARLLGTPDDSTHFTGGVVSAALGGPAVLGELALRVERLEVALGLETGIPVLRLEGLVDGQGATGLTGVWLSLNLAVGLRL